MLQACLLACQQCMWSHRHCHLQCYNDRQPGLLLLLMQRPKLLLDMLLFLMQLLALLQDVLSSSSSNLSHINCSKGVTSAAHEPFLLSTTGTSSRCRLHTHDCQHLLQQPQVGWRAADFAATACPAFGLRPAGLHWRPQQTTGTSYSQMVGLVGFGSARVPNVLQHGCARPPRLEREVQAAARLQAFSLTVPLGAVCGSSSCGCCW